MRTYLAAFFTCLLCGCIAATDNPGQQAASDNSSNSPPAPNHAPSSFLFRVYDARVGAFVPGRFMCDNNSRYVFTADGAQIEPANLTLTQCAVIVAHGNQSVILPLSIDSELFDLFNKTDQYTLKIDSTEFDKRYFIFLNEDKAPLQGALSLDGEPLGGTNNQGIISVDFSLLHPGKMEFTWYYQGQTPAKWELDYISSDMNQLFMQVPTDTVGLGANETQQYPTPSAPA